MSPLFRSPVSGLAGLRFQATRSPTGTFPSLIPPPLPGHSQRTSPSFSPTTPTRRLFSSKLQWNLPNLRKPRLSSTYTCQLEDGRIMVEPARPRLLRPFLFTVGVFVTTFTIAAAVQDRRERQPQPKWLRNYRTDAERFVDFTHTKPLPTESRTAKLARFQRHVDWWNRHRFIPRFVRLAYLRAVLGWINAPLGQRTAYILLAANTAVFALWRIPRLQPFMTRHFTHHPYSGRSYTLVTSAFSHASLMHFAFNMMGIYYFVGPVVNAMTPETFPAFYVSAAAAASFLHHAGTLLLVNPATVLPALGASGVLYSILAIFCNLFPHAQLQIVFLPFWQFEAGWFFKAILAGETAAMFFINSGIAHGVHLAGAAFGYAYLNLFPDIWRKYRSVVARIVDRKDRP